MTKAVGSGVIARALKMPSVISSLVSSLGDLCDFDRLTPDLALKISRILSCETGAASTGAPLPGRIVWERGLGCGPLGEALMGAVSFRMELKRADRAGTGGLGDFRELMFSWFSTGVWFFENLLLPSGMFSS